MNRRHFITALTAVGIFILESPKVIAGNIKKLVLSNRKWRMKLSKKQYNILREEGTERAWSSKLNDEKRDGIYVCTGCDLPLFTSEMKYNSGTGWPSFMEPIKGALETKTDSKLFRSRTEYHCTRCGGHQGHVFKDGPAPTGERWCNNGLALKFIPNDEKGKS